MYIIYVKNYKQKIILFFAITFLWISMILVSGFFMHNSLIYKVTINDFITFSCPFSFNVADIYVNEKLNGNSIQTNLPNKKPDTKKFSSYSSLKGRFSFSYPSAFALNQQDFTGSDILYHIDFHDKNSISNGFVQVWNLPYSLEEFLDTSKSLSKQDYKYFTIKSVTVNNLPGYYWDYSIKTKEGKYYKGSEVFLKKDDRMYRISNFVPENQWNKAQNKIFLNMVNSFKVF